MNAASLHGTLFAGATEVEVGRRIGRLWRFNIAMGVVHAVQGAAILVLATSFTLLIVTYPLTGPPGSPAETITLFDLRIAWAVAVFLFIPAIAHLAIAYPWPSRRGSRSGAQAVGIAHHSLGRIYERMLLNGRNYYRWVEYSLSACLIAVLIALLSGIRDAAASIAIFGGECRDDLFGLLQERYERPGGSMLPFWLGCVVVSSRGFRSGYTWLASAPTSRHPDSSTRSSSRCFSFYVLRRGSVAAVPAGRGLGRTIWWVRRAMWCSAWSLSHLFYTHRFPTPPGTAVPGK